MSESLGNKAIKGAIWSSVEKFGMMGLIFIVNLILARLLTPSDFGSIGILYIFISVSQVLIDGGFGSALIQKKEPTQNHYSTIFWWNLALSVVLYLLLYISSPYVGDFFRNNSLSSVLRGIGLIIIFNSLSLIQNNRLRKQLKFGRLAVANLLSYILGSVMGVIAALEGFGVWSLVIMQVSNSLIQVILLLIVTKWLPSITFSRQYFHELFRFGGYLLVANIFQEICRNFQGIIIGRKFNTTEMGYYSQASKIENMTSSTISTVIGQVMYPVFSSCQDEDEYIRNILRVSIRLISLGAIPLMGFLIILATPIIEMLYGAKWIPTAPYVQILCIGGIFTSMQNINYYVVAAKGKSRQLFTWSIYKWTSMLILLFIGMNFGMLGLMWSIALSNFNIWLINAYLVKKNISFGFMDQIKAICPILFITVIAAFCAFGLSFIIVNYVLIGMVYVIIILLIIYILKLESAKELILLIKKLIHK